MVLPDIRTPTLLLDESVARRNIMRMRDKAEAHGLGFRPHFKTHQSVRVGRWFREAGVNAITVSSLPMARYFADDGWDDITVAFPVNLREADEIAALAARVSLGVTVESPLVAHRLDVLLGAASVPDLELRTWIKVDTGYGRTGIPTTDADLLRATAHAVTRSRHLNLTGLLTHVGDSYQAPDPASARQRFEQGRQKMIVAGEALRSEHPEILLSVGDTPGCVAAEDFSGIDEIRPGNFVFFDVMQLQRGICAPRDVAVALACPVVAIHERREEVVIHGGAVHLSKEHIADRDGTQLFGLVALPEDNGWSDPIPGAAVVRLSQEHGIVRLPAEHIERIEEGDLLVLLPVHSCLAAECMRGYRLLDGGVADHLAGLPAAGHATPAPGSATPQDTARKER